MKRFLHALILLSLLFSICATVSAETVGVVVYVATNGSDSNDGSFQNPFLTMKKAIEYTRNYSGERYIFVREGRYDVTATTSLNSKDKNLTISNFGDESVIFTTSKEIPFSSLKKVTDKSVLDRIIEEDGKNNVLEVKLSDIGITDLGQMKPNGFGVSSTGFAPSLTYNKELLSLAGYPNKMSTANGGYFYTSGVIDNLNFTCDDERIMKYQKAEEPWVLGFFKHDWAETTSAITISGNKITLKTGNSYGITTERRFRVFNLLEELDAPGEYFINRKTGYLYLIPTEDMENGDVLEFTTKELTMFNASGASNVTVMGMTFEGTKSSVFQFYSSKNVCIDNCEFYGIGNAAVRFNSCYNSGVKNSYLHDLNSWGVYFSCGNRTTLTDSGCYVTNSKLERFSQYKRTYAPGIYLSGCGFLINHNYFGDCPHFCIRYDCNEAIMEYNEFENVCNDSSDAGALYTGRDWSMWGNIIRYNYFHHMNMINTTAGMEMQAVYLDDMHARTEVYKNVFYKCDSVALFGGGRNNTFENNLMLECKKPFYFDARGTWGGTWDGSSNTRSLKSMPYTKGIWAEKYPELVNILDDEPLLPKYNVVRANICYKTPEMFFAEPVLEYSTVEYNIIAGDTVYFKDYENEDFTIVNLKWVVDRAPTFEEIPFHDMGMYEVQEESRPSVSVSNLPASCAAGSKIKLNYTQSSDVIDSAVTWFSVDSRGTNVLDGAQGNELAITEALAGKEIKASVTVINKYGEIDVKTTNLSKVEALNYKQALSVTDNGTSYDVSNACDVPISVLAFGVSYNKVGGVKYLSYLSLKQFDVVNEYNVEKSGDKMIIMGKNTLEPIQ